MRNGARRQIGRCVGVSSVEMPSLPRKGGHSSSSSSYREGEPMVNVLQLRETWDVVHDHCAKTAPRSAIMVKDGNTQAVFLA